MAEPGTPPPAFPPHIEDTIRSIAQLNVEHKENASRPQLRCCCFHRPRPPISGADCGNGAPTWK